LAVKAVVADMVKVQTGLLDVLQAAAPPDAVQVAKPAEVAVAVTDLPLEMT
jgi:hypothetical protein